MGYFEHTGWGCFWTYKFDNAKPSLETFLNKNMVKMQLMQYFDVWNFIVSNC